MKQNIIIVGDYNRADALHVAKELRAFFNIYFLEFAYKTEINSDKYKQWGNAIFWNEYESAIDLINKISPNLIVFYLIESYNQVALNVACKFKGVKTFHLEHGIRNYKIQVQNSNQPKEEEKFSSWKRNFQNPIAKIKNRLFFLNTCKRLPSEYGLFLKHYFATRKANNIFETFRLVENRLRLADCYISFSPKVFEFHKINDHLSVDYPVHFIGCPTFDNLANVVKDKFSGNNILFIDSPFEKQNLFGWRKENKIEFLEVLSKFSTKDKRKLWIKPHPLGGEDVYSSLIGNLDVLFVRDEKTLIQAINDSKIIIGFYSTLLMPLMAMPHTVCFSINMHPSPGAEGVSDFLVNTGGIKRIDNWEELQAAFENLEVIFEEQKKLKGKFAQEWLYKFDGKATERLKSILLNNGS